MHKYSAIFRTQLANQLAYPLDLALRSLTIIIFLFIFTQLWQAVYGVYGTGSEQTIAGLSLNQTLWYLMLTESILLSKPRISAAVSAVVKDGSIAYMLNKPYNFLLYQAALGLADGLVRLGFNLLAGGLIVWLLSGPPPGLLHFPVVFLVILLGWAIDFMVSSMIGLAAFITEDITAFDWIYSKLLFLLGGLLVPLEFFPHWLQQISRALPFAFTLYGPARYFVEPDLPRLVWLVSGQALWIVSLGLIVAFIYQRGITRLAINGG